MKPFEAYFQEPGNRRFKAFQSNQTLKAIYEYMCMDKQVESMIEASEDDRPALEAVIDGIEKRFPFDGEFDLVTTYRHRQILGSFCRFILSPYNYHPLKSVKMKKGHYINTGTIYKRT